MLARITSPTNAGHSADPLQATTLHCLCRQGAHPAQGLGDPSPAPGNPAPAAGTCLHPLSSSHCLSWGCSHRISWVAKVSPPPRQGEIRGGQEWRGNPHVWLEGEPCLEPTVKQHCGPAGARAIYSLAKTQTRVTQHQTLSCREKNHLLQDFGVATSNSPILSSLQKNLEVRQ